MVPLYVNKVSSDTNQLPYAYYDLPFVCEPPQAAQRVGLNLGEVLRGDRIWESEYGLLQNIDNNCSELCTKKVDKHALERANELIKSSYLVEWILDNLPGATAFISVDRSKRYYSAGFPLGSVDKQTGEVMLNNHVTLLIRYRKSDRDSDRHVIVGFEVYPKSVSNSGKICPGESEVYSPYILDTTKESDEIRYTYSVFWREDNTIEWANRWDMYFSYSDRSNSIHWLAIVNSLVIAALLAIFVGVIMVRTLSRDIQSYRQQLEMTGNEANKEPIDDGSGWKLVRADVFRPPMFSSVLSAVIGSGIQLLVMSTTVICFACIGLLNPSYRGGFLSYALFLFAFAGIFGGYVSARLSNDLGSGQRWARSLLLTASLVPASLLIIILLLNMFLWAQASSSALPFGTVVALFCIWLLISCPLVIVGGFIGHRVKPSDKLHTIPSIARQIPRRPKAILRSLPIAVLGGGLLPFAVIFVELIFVFKSFWQDNSGFYYMYGFFGLVSFVLIVTVMEMSIVTTYFLLNSEDYRWWWRSFYVGTGSAWWIFIYSIYYYYCVSDITGFVSSLIFFGYSIIGCVIYGLVTGSIGFLASYAFVHRIYTAIKGE